MTIENKLNTQLSVVVGAFCGMIKYFTGYLETMFIINLLQAGLTALVCGALGVAGKELYGYGKKKYKAYRSERIKRKAEL